MIAQGRLAAGLGAVVLVQAEEFLAGVRQQPAEYLRGGKLGIEVRRLGGHAQRVVITTHLHALAAALAKVTDENRENTAVARVLLFHAAPNGGHVIVSQRQLVDDVQELATGGLVNGGQLIHLGAQDILERRLFLGGHHLVHFCAATLIQAGHLVEQRLLLCLIIHVIANGRNQNCADILRGIRQRRVRAGGDALHALGAVFRNVNRRLTTGDVLALRRATGRAHDAEAGQRARRLVIAKVIAEFTVKFLKRLERMPFLTFGHRTTGATAGGAAGSLRHLNAVGVIGRQHRVAHAGSIRGIDLAVVDLRDAVETAEHHLHVGLHNLLAKAAELFLVRLAHDVVIILLRNLVVLEEAGHLEKAAEERVALHPQLQVRPAGGLARHVKARENVHLDVVLLHKLPMLGGNALPRGLGGLVTFPYKTRTFL